MCLVRENPKITTSELANELEIILKGVEWNIGKMKKEGLIKRIGPDNRDLNTYNETKIN